MIVGVFRDYVLLVNSDNPLLFEAVKKMKEREDKESSEAERDGKGSNRTIC